MSACTFFGHSDSPLHIRPQLKRLVLSLIESGVREFYVGDKGNFDLMAASVLREIYRENHSISYSVVLSYLPAKPDYLQNSDYIETMYPEGLEKVPLRYAIVWRNKWMLQKCDYVICYVKYTWGGAYKFVELAEKKGKTVINLARPI